MKAIRTLTSTSPAGNSGRIVVRTGDPISGRFEVFVNGRCVGFGFADADEAADRGVEFVLRGGLEGKEWA